MSYGQQFSFPESFPSGPWVPLGDQLDFLMRKFNELGPAVLPDNNYFEGIVREMWGQWGETEPPYTVTVFPSPYAIEIPFNDIMLIIGYSQLVARSAILTNASPWSLSTFNSTTVSDVPPNRHFPFQRNQSPVLTQSLPSPSATRTNRASSTSAVSRKRSYRPSPITEQPATP